MAHSPYNPGRRDGVSAESRKQLAAEVDEIVHGFDRALLALAEGARALEKAHQAWEEGLLEACANVLARRGRTDAETRWVADHLRCSAEEIVRYLSEHEIDLEGGQKMGPKKVARKAVALFAARPLPPFMHEARDASAMRGATIRRNGARTSVLSVFERLIDAMIANSESEKNSSA